MNTFNFKDSLPDEFLHISTIWKNQFDYMNEKTPVFRATIAKPDTDYQYAVLYALSDDGKFELFRVEDESYNGSEEE